MSIHVSKAVWKYSAQRGSGLLVLLALADHARDDGWAWPSVETLAGEVRLSRRQVQQHLQRLATAGEIEVEDQTGPHGVNRYRVNLGHLRDETHPCDAQQGEESCTPEAERIEGAKPAAPEPSSTHQEKKANASAKRRREPSAVQAAHQAMFAALRDVCEMDQSLSSNRGRLNRVAKEIVEAGRYSPEQIRAWYGPGGWWYTSDFRGKDRPRPLPEQVPKTLLQAMNAQQPEGGRTIEAPRRAVIQVRTGGQV